MKKSTQRLGLGLAYGSLVVTAGFLGSIPLACLLAILTSLGLAIWSLVRAHRAATNSGRGVALAYLLGSILVSLGAYGTYYKEAFDVTPGEALFYSVAVWTTLGDSSQAVGTDLLRFVVATQVFMGFLTMGTLLAHLLSFLKTTSQVSWKAAEKDHYSRVIDVMGEFLEDDSITGMDVLSIFSRETAPHEDLRPSLRQYYQRIQARMRQKSFRYRRVVLVRGTPHPALAFREEVRPEFIKHLEEAHSKDNSAINYLYLGRRERHLQPAFAIFRRGEQAVALVLEFGVAKVMNEHQVSGLLVIKEPREDVIAAFDTVFRHYRALDSEVESALGEGWEENPLGFGSLDPSRISSLRSHFIHLPLAIQNEVRKQALAACDLADDCPDLRAFAQNSDDLEIKESPAGFLAYRRDEAVRVLHIFPHGGSQIPPTLVPYCDVADPERAGRRIYQEYDRGTPSIAHSLLRRMKDGHLSGHAVSFFEVPFIVAQANRLDIEACLTPGSGTSGLVIKKLAQEGHALDFARGIVQQWHKITNRQIRDANTVVCVHHHTYKAIGHGPDHPIRHRGGQLFRWKGVEGKQSSQSELLGPGRWIRIRDDMKACLRDMSGSTEIDVRDSEPFETLPLLPFHGTTEQDYPDCEHLIYDLNRKELASDVSVDAWVTWLLEQTTNLVAEVDAS